MIVYRKTQPLRVRRASAPEPPFWCASIVQPYSAKRAAPIAIDYVTLRATAADRVEVNVCENVRDELERMRALAGPVLIEATESAEPVFRRGEEIFAFCEENSLASIDLVSARGALPLRPYADGTVAISCWPGELARIEELFSEAADKKLSWGAVVPLLFPVTTDLEWLALLADLAEEKGAQFLCGLVVHSDATARQELAQSMSLEPDDDRYALMFHGSLEPILVSSERHLAALASERGLADFVVPPRWEERSNWNAAALLTLTASRMMAMELDLDLAGTIARSARIVAELDKALTRIAEAATLSIVGGLDETSVDMLTEWIGGNMPSFFEYVADQWRLRRT